MKKLMIAAAIVCAAVMSQAAQATWASGALKTAEDSTGGWSTTTALAGNALITMRVILIDQATYKTITGTGDPATTAWTQKQIYDAYKGSTSTAQFSGQNLNATGGIANQFTLTQPGDVPEAQQWAVILADYSDATLGKDFYMASAVQNTYVSAQKKGSASNLLSGIANWQTESTPVIPEPTSGLLLLIGVAGLALRRRRA